ncbi:MAG: substrate-binding domain-containing protein [Bacilli bacterium]|jgi:ribose transport system substrate-binding protein|nr:substrate-binding domain-containing protein [Bacilli bacterium]
MKKSVMSLLALAVVAGCCLTSCGNGAAKTVEVLVQTADHGWTGAVQSYAKEKVDALNKEGKYKVNLTACEDATVEANKVADLLVNKDALNGIVLLPIDNTMSSSLDKIVAANVPFVQFDRVVKTDNITNAACRVSNVLGDNYGIGVATAKRFIQKGIKPGEKILIMPGDNSSVPVSRTSGFTDTLKSEGGWTDAQLKDAIYTTDYTGWSRTKSIDLFTNWVNLGTYADYKWIFTHDDEIAMGILETLNSTRVTDDVKTWFKESVTSLASSSSLDEIYAVMEGKHTTDYKGLFLQHCYLFDVTYDPAMIQTAIQDMIDHLDGKTVTKDHVIAVNTVDADNVSQFKGFGSGNYRVA